MEKGKLNRIEQEISRWRDEEERFRQLFSFDLSTNKALFRQKLRDLDNVAIKYRDTMDPSEKTSLFALKQERRHLEKLAYKNVFVRLIRRFVIAPIKRQFKIVKQKKMERLNQTRVTNILNRMGIKDQDNNVQQQIQKGQNEFALPVSQYVNERERLEGNIVFEKGSNGDYQLASNQVVLKDEFDPALSRKHKFELKNGDLVSVQDQYNLLNGRAVYKHDKWMVLDLNDQDLNGNYRVKEFSNTYGFQVEKVIDELPLKELKIPGRREEIIKELKKGNLVKININSRRYEIAANPQFKSLDYYNENKQRVSKSEAFGRKNEQQRDVKNKVDKSERKQRTIRIA